MLRFSKLTVHTTHLYWIFPACIFFRYTQYRRVDLRNEDWKMHWRRDGTPLSRSLGTNNNICLYIYTTSKTYYIEWIKTSLRFLIFRPIMTTDGEDPVKCPCCDNPWSRGAGDMYAQLCAMCEETKEDGGEVPPPPGPVEGQPGRDRFPHRKLLPARERRLGQGQSHPQGLP